MPRPQGSGRGHRCLFTALPPQHLMKLVAFDGDYTLWTPLSGLNLTDRTPTDRVGSPHYTFAPLPNEPLKARRDDGALFVLRPEAHGVLAALRSAGVLTAVVSYNHLAPVQSALDAFGILPLMDYIVAEWHTNKDLMLAQILQMASEEGRDVAPRDALLVDDDPEGIYGPQCLRMGARLVRFGHDIHDLREILPLAGAGPTEETR